MKKSIEEELSSLERRIALLVGRYRQIQGLNAQLMEDNSRLREEISARAQGRMIFPSPSSKGEHMSSGGALSGKKVSSSAFFSHKADIDKYISYIDQCIAHLHDFFEQGQGSGVEGGKRRGIREKGGRGGKGGCG